MKLKIVVDSTLPSGSAEIREETLRAALAISHPGEKDFGAWRRVGDPFGPAFSLIPVRSAARDLGALYVSSDVKSAFYPQVHELTVGT